MLTKPSEIYTKYLGLRDYVASGCFNHDTGELRPGFTIMPEDVVLDVGCGDGIDCHFCGERGAHVIYADRDPAKMALARNLIAGSGARASTPIITDANPLPLADSVASKVIASEIIEHVDDPAEFLKELIRVGKPGAQYLLSVPDPASEDLQKGLAVAAYFEKTQPYPDHRAGGVRPPCHRCRTDHRTARLLRILLDDLVAVVLDIEIRSGRAAASAIGELVDHLAHPARHARKRPGTPGAERDIAQEPIYRCAKARRPT